MVINFTKIGLFFLFIGQINSVYGLKLSEKKVLICGIGKNVASAFNTTKTGISEIGACCKDYRILIYENNSQDNTVKLYSDWENLDPKLHFIHENLGYAYFNSVEPKKGFFHIEWISRARNIILQEAMAPQYDEYDYVIMADLDEFEPWNVEAIVNSIESPQQEWDAIFANGSFDLYAFRTPAFLFGPEWLGLETWRSLYHYYGLELGKELQNGKWLKVDSAFGGLAIYRREALRGCHYYGRLTPALVKGFIDADFSKDCLFYRFSPELQNFVFRQRNILELWAKDNCSIDSPVYKAYNHLEVYLCEHVSLHQQMKKNGFDKLYINPALIHRSKQHFNY